MNKVQTFLAIGGHLHGEYIKDGHEDYVRFNSSIGEVYPEIIIERNGKNYRVSGKSKLARKNKIVPYIPSCVLLYFPYPDNIILKG